MPGTDGQKTDRTNEADRTAIQTLKQRLLEFSRRHKSAIRASGIAAWVSSVALSMSVAAQGVDQADSIMCGAGGGPNIGALLMVVFALVAMVLLIKVAFMGMFAFDKLNSPREQEHLEGQEQLKSAGWTFLGALVPLIFGALMDVMGVNTLSCIDWNIGIMMAFPVPF